MQQRGRQAKESGAESKGAQAGVWRRPRRCGGERTGSARGGRESCAHQRCPHRADARSRRSGRTRSETCGTVFLLVRRSRTCLPGTRSCYFAGALRRVSGLDRRGGRSVPVHGAGDPMARRGLRDGGGRRWGRPGGSGGLGPARWARMVRTTAGSWTVAMTRRRPPQWDRPGRRGRTRGAATPPRSRAVWSRRGPRPRRTAPLWGRRRGRPYLTTWRRPRA